MNDQRRVVPASLRDGAVPSRRGPMRDAIALLLALVALTGSCAPEGSAPRRNTEADEVNGRARTQDPVPPASPGEWVVHPFGVGRLRIGMRLAELLPRLESGADTAAVAGSCAYVAVEGAPEGLGFMVEERRFVRIDVWGGPTATAEGARVGDSEDRILSLYPGAERRPHKYTDGFYLVVIPGAPGDTLHRYVFETDGRRVTTYRAGILPPVEYVEGCS